MTLTEYHAALARLNLKPASTVTAAALGLSLRQCQRIAAGHCPVPEPVAIILRLHGATDTPDPSPARPTGR